METVAYVAIAAAVLMAVGTILAGLSALAHSAHRDQLADELEVAHEALDVAGTVGAKIANGEPLASAIVSSGASAEAQDLLRRFKTFAHLALVLLAFAFLATGCGVVSKAEYETFVKASRDFYDRAAPIVTTTVASDPNLNDQSKKNRVGFVDDYRLALESAEARAAGVK